MAIVFQKRNFQVKKKILKEFNPEPARVIQVVPYLNLQKILLYAQWVCKTL